MTNDEIEKWIHGAATIRPEREQVMAATAKSAAEDLRQIKMGGISRVMVRGSRTGKNCVACQPFIGIQYTVENAPVIPPMACTCDPWCMLIYVAKP